MFDQEQIGGKVSIELKTKLLVFKKDYTTATKRDKDEFWE